LFTIWQLEQRVKKIDLPSSKAPGFSVAAGKVLFSAGWFVQPVSIAMKTMKGKNFMAQK
jgi:hypothetical protein